ncbi:hypothetical protein SORBI_3003G140800 [Sorghum bicolor]|uniref:Uncharacterized protein n=1 Tax=Sorghum bicolor TaxID=4558 RepID=A0A1W0VXA1_SORBI|nr:hypothetical protein SORBI_3003G140800 [Sorghum bicolor]
MAWQWQCFLSFAVVAVSAAASLGAIIRANNKLRRRRPPREDDAASAAAPPPPWISCWSLVPPSWLLAFRATAAVALAAVLAWDLRTYDPSIMMYYTEWTLLLEIAYFAAATLCSAYGCRMVYYYYPSRDRAVDPDPESDDKRLLGQSGGGDEANPNGDDAWKGAGRLGLQLMQIGYQVSAGAVVLTDAVFWGLIVPFTLSAHFSLNAVMACIHSLNLVFLLIETALNNLDFPWFRMPYFVLWTCLYVIIQWIAHVCGMTCVRICAGGLTLSSVLNHPWHHCGTAPDQSVFLNEYTFSTSLFLVTANLR